MNDSLIETDSLDPESYYFELMSKHTKIVMPILMISILGELFYIF